jgi:hypothetical protein
VDIHELMIEMRRASEVTDRYEQAYRSVSTCGYAFRLNEQINDLRASFDLAPLELISPRRLRILLADWASDLTERESSDA